jgi:hypothetical protein
MRVTRAADLVLHLITRKAQGWGHFNLRNATSLNKKNNLFVLTRILITTYREMSYITKSYKSLNKVDAATRTTEHETEWLVKEVLYRTVSDVRKCGSSVQRFGIDFWTKILQLC